jgi:ParB-like nuclease domain
MTTEQVNPIIDRAGDRAGDVVLVPFSSIKVNEKENVRSHYEGIEELAKNIQANGLLTPLTVDQDDKLVAGYRRHKALQIVHAKEPDALVKVTRKVCDAPSVGMLLNLAENARDDIPDFDMAKRLFELSDENGKFGIKRSMLEKATCKSKTAVGKYITTWEGICAKVRKAWEASTHGELKDVDGKPIILPTVRVYEMSKKDEKTQHKMLAAFLDHDRAELEPEGSDGGGDDEEKGGSRSNGAGEETTSRAPKKKEIKEFLEKLEAKVEKGEKLSKEDIGRQKALRWVIGDLGRRTMMTDD